MIIRSRRIISHTTKKDLGNESPWFKAGCDYIVLSLTYVPQDGFSVCLFPEKQMSYCYADITGFEIVSQKRPSNWITSIEKGSTIDMAPQSWSYETFSEDLSNGDPKAVKLFKEEAVKIYAEEGVEVDEDYFEY